jgi:two-component system response regulator YesN
VYSVLIVDDEEPVLESYEFMLKSAPGFTLAGKARSGYEALRLIHEAEPDLVFMDINIPGLDGLEVIADVHKKFSSMIFILSTAYERFDLAQRAIPLGVFAYLVKPVSKRTFFSTLDKVREVLEARPPGESFDEEHPRRYFFRRTIWKEISGETWETCRERLSLPSDKGIPFMLELDQDPEKWCGKVLEKLSYKHPCCYDVLLNRGLFLVSEDMDRETLREQLGAVLKEVLPETTAYFLGIGTPRRGPELYLSCDEALRELENQRKGAKVHHRERLRLIQLRRKIGAAEPEEVKKLFTALWGEVFTAYDFTLAKAKMVSVFMFLMDDCTGCYHDPEDAPLFAPAEEIMAIPDMARWESWVSGAFEKILLQTALRRSESLPFPLAKALEYIRGHYAEGIQLHSAAEAARVSPAYLSRLFSEHLKTSFVDYLTELRMEQAEKLIRKSKMNIKEVAFAVGYQDPNYFSKIFRKITGVSPTVYASEEPREGQGVKAGF